MASPLALSSLSLSCSATGCRLRILCWLRFVIELHYAGDIGHSLRRSLIIPRIGKRRRRRRRGRERERRRGKRGSWVRDSTGLSCLQNFIGDYHNVPCPCPGSIVVLSPFRHYSHSLQGFARGEAWILEVHYQRHRYRYRYKDLLQIWVFPFASLAAGVGLGKRVG